MALDATNKPETLKGRRGRCDGLHRDSFNKRFNNPGYVEAVATNKPQAMVKIVSQARGYRARVVMEYISRTTNQQEKESEREPDQDKSLAFEDANGIKHKGREAVFEKYENWKKDFERAKPGSKRPPRHVAHMILSASTENTEANAKKVLAAAREVLHEHLNSRGYDYILVLHRDTDKPHVHVAINNYNQLEKKQKLRLNPPDLFALRMAFAEKLNALGIEQAATLRRDRPHLLNAVEKGIEKLRQRQEWYKAKMRQAAPDLDALKQRREAAKKIVALKAEIKEVTLPFSPLRKEAMAKLRELDKVLIIPAADIGAAAEAAFRRIQKDHGQLRAFAQDLARPPADAPKLSYRQQLQRRRAIEKLRENALKNIGQARSDIIKSDAPQAQRAAMLQRLRALERGFGRDMGHSNSP